MKQLFLEYNIHIIKAGSVINSTACLHTSTLNAYDHEQDASQVERRVSGRNNQQLGILQA